MQREQARGVRADAEVAGVSERRQAAVPDEEVEARGEEAEDEDLRQQEDAVVVQQGGRDDEQRERGGADRDARPRHCADRPPRIPCGRRMRISAIAPKSANGAAWGRPCCCPSATPSDCTSPMSSEATKAPGDRAEAPDHDDDEGEQQHVVADSGGHLLDGPADDAGERRERRTREQHRQHHEVHVVTERRDHLPVDDRRPQDRAELRPFEHEVGGECDDGADDDHADPVRRVVVTEDDPALAQKPRRRDRVEVAAPDDRHEVLR